LPKLKHEIDEVEDLPLWIKSNIYYLLKKVFKALPLFVCLFDKLIYIRGILIKNLDLNE